MSLTDQEKYRALTRWNLTREIKPPRAVVWVANCCKSTVRTWDASVYPGISADDYPYWRHTPESLEEFGP